MLIIFTPYQIFDIINVFELLPKTCNFTICSIFINSGHVGWCTASPDTILKLDTLVMIQTKFGFHLSSTFRGEDFWKSLRRTTDDDDGRQVIAIAHMTLWVRWTNNNIQFVEVWTLKTIFTEAFRLRWILISKVHKNSSWPIQKTPRFLQISVWLLQAHRLLRT